MLHRDAAVLVLDKPAGLPVHPGPRGGPSVEDWLPALAFGKRRLPQPAHRLDADTAGCLVLGRTKPALAALGALFAAGRVDKFYWAVVRGEPPGREGELFGLYATTGRAVSFLAPAMFALFIALFGAQRWGILGIGLVLLLGLAAFLPVRAVAGGAAAGEAAARV